MTVYFIGAGPGAADLLTLRADALIRRCEVCLYAGSIVPPEVLEHCPDGADVINTARMPLDAIVETIAKADSEGKDVARLQSGDPSLWSALAEQARRLAERNIDSANFLTILPRKVSRGPRSLSWDRRWPQMSSPIASFILTIDPAMPTDVPSPVATTKPAPSRRSRFRLNDC